MSDKTPSIAALIPARAGSKRVPNKNIRSLAGHPLIAYTISAALQSEIFRDVIFSTDSSYYGDIARYYGAEVPFLRPYPSQANFILCRVMGVDAAALKNDLAVRYGILVRYFNAPGLQDHIRISVGRPEDTDRLLKALSTVGRLS